MRVSRLFIFLLTSSCTCTGFIVPRTDRQKIRRDSLLLSPTSRQQSTTLYSADPENSISDYTLGLHGGKYQFDTAGMSFEARQFAETGYGSTEEYQEEDFSNEPLPKWALRLQSQPPPENCPILQVNADGGTPVSFSNEERSWERFYAMIISGADNDAAEENAGIYTVEPSAGQLAPRGGSGKYGDSGQVLVNKLQGSDGTSPDCWLVIGTEAERWYYKLPSPDS